MGSIVCFFSLDSPLPKLDACTSGECNIRNALSSFPSSNPRGTVVKGNQMFWMSAERKGGDLVGHVGTPIEEYPI